MATGEPLEEELCGGRRWLLLGGWGRSWRTAAAAVAAAGGGGWLREEELGPVSAGPPPGWSLGRLDSDRRDPQARGRCSLQDAGVCIYILTVCRSACPACPARCASVDRRAPAWQARQESPARARTRNHCPAERSSQRPSHGGRRPGGTWLMGGAGCVARPAPAGPAGSRRSGQDLYHHPAERSSQRPSHGGRRPDGTCLPSGTFPASLVLVCRRAQPGRPGPGVSGAWHMWRRVE